MQSENVISVSHIALRDSMGGAAIAAYRLHAGLRKVGVRSSMVVSWKTTSDPDVRQLAPKATLWDRAVRRLRARRLNVDRRRVQSALVEGAGLFSDDRTIDEFPLAAATASADVVNIHQSPSFLDYRKFFRQRDPSKPLVWTLHDMSPFTGGCHSSFSCTRFRSACGACPSLASHEARDESARSHARKAQALRRLVPAYTRIVVPSRWMADQAKSSALLGRFEIVCIPHGLDFDVFQPRDRRAAREVFGIPQGELVVMFAAAAIDQQSKGLRYLLEAMQHISVERPVTLVSLGVNSQQVTTRHNYVAVGALTSERLLSYAYSAADIFVTPSLAESFGLVALEAMACGVPVIGTHVGGLPDMIRNGENGLLVKPQDAAELHAAIASLLADAGLRRRMADAARTTAVGAFSLDKQSRRYEALYRNLVKPGQRLQTP